MSFLPSLEKDYHVKGQVLWDELWNGFRSTFWSDASGFQVNGKAHPTLALGLSNDKRSMS